MPRRSLDRGAIVAEAFALLAERGLPGLTARALAERLGVRAGALYYHLPDMRALLDEMATDQLRAMRADPLDDDDWERMLRASADRIRTVLGRHRDGARVFAGSRITDPRVIEGTEGSLAVLVAAGLPLDRAMWTLQTLQAWATGFMIEEQHRRHEEPEAYRGDVRRAALDADAAPLTVAATDALLADADARFRWGVDLLVEGVRRALADQDGTRSERASAAPGSDA